MLKYPTCCCYRCEADKMKISFLASLSHTESHSYAASTTVGSLELKLDIVKHSQVKSTA